MKRRRRIAKATILLISCLMCSFVLQGCLAQLLSILGPLIGKLLGGLFGGSSGGSSSGISSSTPSSAAYTVSSPVSSGVSGSTFVPSSPVSLSNPGGFSPTQVPVTTLTGGDAFSGLSMPS